MKTFFKPPFRCTLCGKHGLKEQVCIPIRAHTPHRSLRILR